MEREEIIDLIKSTVKDELQIKNKGLVKTEIIDFVNTTGKNIGEIQNMKLAKYFGEHEGSIRYMKKSDSLKFECLYLGALCKANNVSREQIIQLLQNL